MTDTQRMKELFDKLLTGYMLMDDEYEFLVKQLQERSIKRPLEE